MPPQSDFKIIQVGREIRIYREGDQYVPFYAESFKKDGHYYLEVEAGGIRYWHPSCQPITEAQRQIIINRITCKAEESGSVCEIKDRATSQIGWELRWDKILKMIATVEALPYQVKFKGWAWQYTKGALQVTIPIIKPFYIEDYKVIRLKPPRDWVLNHGPGPIPEEQIKRDVNEWARISEFAIEFVNDISTPAAS